MKKSPAGSLSAGDSLSAVAGTAVTPQANLALLWPLGMEIPLQGSMTGPK